MTVYWGKHIAKWNLQMETNGKDMPPLKPLKLRKAYKLVTELKLQISFSLFIEALAWILRMEKANKLKMVCQFLFVCFGCDGSFFTDRRKNWNKKKNCGESSKNYSIYFFEKLHIQKHTQRKHCLQMFSEFPKLTLDGSEVF